MAKKFIDEIWHVHSFIQSFTEASIQWCCNRVTSVNPVPFIILYAYALRQADLHLSNKILSNWSYQKRSRVDRSFYFSLFLAPDSLLYRLVKAISIKKINSCLCIEWSNWKKKVEWVCVCVYLYDWWSEEFGTGSRSWDSAPVPYPSHCFSQVLWL